MFERKSRFSGIGDNKEDDKSFKFFEDVIENSQCIFSKHSEQKRSFFGLVKGDTRTVVEVDQTHFTHSAGNNQKGTKQSIQRNGYCIRTGVGIPYDLNKPFSKEAYYSWANFSNPNYPEKFCHFSGEKSNGQTCFAVPFLEKYERDAISNHDKIHS